LSEEAAMLRAIRLPEPVFRAPPPLFRLFIADRPQPFQDRVSVMKYSVRRALRLVLFKLELDALEISDGAPAHKLQPNVGKRLLERLQQLVREVQAAPLTARDRNELLAVLRKAIAILNSDEDPATIRSGLEHVLGRSIAKAGRGGPTARLWTRVAEAVVLAEATVSLGLGIAAITSPATAQVSVICEVDLPALPAGDDRPDGELPQLEPPPREPSADGDSTKLGTELG